MTKQRAIAVHGMAAGAYPVFKGMPPTRFLRLLAASEIAVGTVLLTPFVSNGAAGAALTGFSGGLVLHVPAYRPRSTSREATGLLLPASASAKISGCSGSASACWQTPRSSNLRS